MTHAELGPLVFAWLLGFGLAVPARLWSQAVPSEVRVASDAIGAADLEVLRAALSRLDIPLQRAVGAAPDCVGTPTERVTLVRVWISWRPGECMRLCFEDGAGKHARTLGPFDTLDASAREQLITVIESGIEAAQLSMPMDQPPPPTAAVAQPRPRTNAARSDSGRSSVGMGMGFSLLAENVSAFWLGAWFEHALYPRALHLAAELDYVPPFGARLKAWDLGVQGQCVRLGLSPVGRIELFAWLRLNVALGPALEWCTLTPLASSQWMLSDTRETSHLDPLLFGRVGPVFGLGRRLTLSIQAGSELLFRQRSYGFFATDQLVNVLAFYRMRFTVLAEIGVQL